jgi:hypothetical protein
MADNIRVTSLMRLIVLRTCGRFDKSDDSEEEANRHADGPIVLRNVKLLYRDDLSRRST